jgi:hypothetical protein
MGRRFAPGGLFLVLQVRRARQGEVCLNALRVLEHTAQAALHRGCLDAAEHGRRGGGRIVSPESLSSFALPTVLAGSSSLSLFLSGLPAFVLRRAVRPSVAKMSSAISRSWCC